MTTELQILFSGLTTGAIYALVAIGFTLIYSSSDVINFAQGEFVMLGGMIASALLSAGVSLPLSIIVAITSTVLVGIVLYLLAIRPARNASPIALIIITIGASIFIRGGIAALLGKDFHSMPFLLPNPTIHIGGATIQSQALLVILSAGALVALLTVILFTSPFGRAVRATAANRVAAALVGINPELIIGSTFAISALIGAIGGILITPITLTSSDSGSLLAIKGFAAAMLGGLGHPAGPVLGGLIIGLLEATSAGYLSSQYKDAITFGLLLGVLLFRPHGLLSRRTIERV